MNAYLTLFVITVIVVNLVDLSGFIDTVKHWIWKWAFKGKKEYQDFDFRPFECSYCMTHWSGLIYLLIAGQFSLLTYMWLLILCFLTTVLKDALFLIRSLLQRMVDAVWEYFQL